MRLTLVPAALSKMFGSSVKQLRYYIARRLGVDSKYVRPGRPGAPAVIMMSRDDLAADPFGGNAPPERLVYEWMGTHFVEGITETLYPSGPYYSRINVQAQGTLRLACGTHYIGSLHVASGSILEIDATCGVTKVCSYDPLEFSGTLRYTAGSPIGQALFLLLVL